MWWREKEVGARRGDGDRGRDPGVRKPPSQRRAGCSERARRPLSPSGDSGGDSGSDSSLVRLIPPRLPSPLSHSPGQLCPC